MPNPRLSPHVHSATHAIRSSVGLQPNPVINGTVIHPCFLQVRPRNRNEVQALLFFYFRCWSWRCSKMTAATSGGESGYYMEDMPTRAASTLPSGHQASTEFKSFQDEAVLAYFGKRQQLRVWQTILPLHCCVLMYLTEELWPDIHYWADLYNTHYVGRGLDVSWRSLSRFCGRRA